MAVALVAYARPDLALNPLAAAIVQVIGVQVPPILVATPDVRQV